MKIIIDILLFILMLLEFSRIFIAPIWHEIFGIILIILVIFHLLINKNYIKNIFKGKYNLVRITALVINALFMLTFFLSILFGILSSEELLKELNINNLTIIKAHKICAYTCLIFMGMHLGINLNAIFRKFSKYKIVLYILEILTVIYGIYIFIKLDILKHILGIYGFSIIEGNIILNLFNYVMLEFMIVIVVHNIYKLLKRGMKK